MRIRGEEKRYVMSMIGEYVPHLVRLHERTLLRDSLTSIGIRILSAFRRPSRWPVKASLLTWMQARIAVTGWRWPCGSPTALGGHLTAPASRPTPARLWFFPWGGRH